MEHNELPIGFGIALAQNPQALKRFSDLGEAEKIRIIEGTHLIKSKEEMQKYVADIK